MVKKLTSFFIMLFVLSGGTLSLADSTDDETATCNELIAAAKEYWELQLSSKHSKYEVVAVDRIYKQSFDTGGDYYEVLTTLRQTNIIPIGTIIETKYSQTPFKYNPDKRRFELLNLPLCFNHWKTIEEYKTAIGLFDRQKRIIRLPDLHQKPSSTKGLLLYAKTQAPSQIVLRDADVVAAKTLLSHIPLTQGLSGDKFRTIARTRQESFKQIHYFVGRIEIRRAAAAKTGRLDEKQKLLQEAIRKWASNLDTHSVKPPKPTIETIAAFEPAEETFTRHLAEAYDVQLAEIQSQLVILLQQIAFDTESPFAAEGSKQIVESLPVEAQDEKDRGRKSLGGEPQVVVDEFSLLLRRCLIPVLVGLGETEVATSPEKALEELISALTKAEESVVADVRQAK